MLKLDRPISSDRSDVPGALGATNRTSGLDPTTLLWGLRRDWRRTLICLLVFGGLGLGYAFTATRMFTATANVLIDERRARFDEGTSIANRSATEMGMDSASIESQVEVLESEKIAVETLRRLDLQSDASFAKPMTFFEQASAGFARLRGVQNSEATVEGIAAGILEGFMRRTTVKRVHQTFVLAISFSDPSPERAATIANTLAEVYAYQQISNAAAARDQIVAWLKARIAAAQADVAEAEASMASNGADPVVRRQLERNLDARHRIYESYISKANAAVQRDVPPVSSVSILATAIPPRHGQPNLPISLGIALIAGCFAALMLSVLRTVRDAVTQATLRAVRVRTDAWTHLDDTAVIGVVSAIPGEGRSFVAKTLAETISADGFRVLLVDADAKQAASAKDHGLARKAFDKAIDHDGTRGFDFLPASAPFRDSTGTLTGQDLQALLGQVSRSYDYIIIDSPPLSNLAGATGLANRIGVFVLVVGWGTTNSAVIVQALHASPLVVEKLVGSVLNNVDLKAFRGLVQDARDLFYAVMRSQS
jgi:Mrp family chromosome partitioning ATPase